MNNTRDTESNNNTNTNNELLIEAYLVDDEPSSPPEQDREVFHEEHEQAERRPTTTLPTAEVMRMVHIRDSQVRNDDKKDDVVDEEQPLPFNNKNNNETNHPKTRISMWMGLVLLVGVVVAIVVGVVVGVLVAGGSGEGGGSTTTTNPDNTNGNTNTDDGTPSTDDQPTIPDPDILPGDFGVYETGILQQRDVASFHALQWGVQHSESCYFPPTSALGGRQIRIGCDSPNAVVVLAEEPLPVLSGSVPPSSTSSLLTPSDVTLECEREAANEIVCQWNSEFGDQPLTALYHLLVGCGGVLGDDAALMMYAKLEEWDQDGIVAPPLTDPGIPLSPPELECGQMVDELFEDVSTTTTIHTASYRGDLLQWVSMSMFCFIDPQDLLVDPEASPDDAFFEVLPVGCFGGSEPIELNHSDETQHVCVAHTICETDQVCTIDDTFADCTGDSFCYIDVEDLPVVDGLTMFHQDGPLHPRCIFPVIDLPQEQELRLIWLDTLRNNLVGSYYDISLELSLLLDIPPNLNFAS